MVAIKRELQLFFAATVMVVMFAGAADAAEPKSYPLMCKGGGDYDFSIRQSSRPDNSVGTEIYFGYKISAGAATAGLQPGQCAWMDRALSNAGQKRLLMYFPGVNMGVQLRKRNGAVLPPYFLPAGSAAEIKSMLDKITGGGEFQVYAYYDRSKEMLVATRIGP